MKKRFELFVALRYLRAKRKQAVISIITGISVVGVAAGVMALVIALAINTGLRNTIQRNLLAATPHVTVLETKPEFGIADWRDKTALLSRLPHVSGAAPALYATVMFNGINAAGGILEGILPPDQAAPPEALRHLKEGGFGDWKQDSGGYPPILIGAELARTTGMGVGGTLRVLSAQGTPSPFGARPAQFSFRVAGIFDSGFYEVDSTLAFAPLQSVQRVLSVNDVVNAIILTLDDVFAAPEVSQAAEKAVGPELSATNWQEQNRRMLGAFAMEKVVTAVTIGLIQLVAALNILISLVMMVMEKHRDIAILLSMGTRPGQIRRIFMLQGVLIGAVGTATGLVLGYALCYFANQYHWIPLDESVYMVSFVPFEPRALDGLWIASAAMAVSFLATIYPARSAARIAPAEALRYE